MGAEASSSSQGALEKFVAPGNYGQQHYSQYGQSPGWTEVDSPSLMSPTTPFTGRITGFFCCPGCGFGFRPQDGYQQVPTNPLAVASERSPYMAEKPPSMPMPSTESFAPTNLQIPQQPSLSYQEQSLTSPPLANFPLIPEQSQLTVPLMSDVNTVQPDGLPAPDYYTNEPMKTEPEITTQTVLTSDHLAQQDLSAIPYNASVGPVVPVDITRQAIETTAAMTQYDLVSIQPSQPLDEPVPQDGLPPAWADASLLDQHANFDILLPNQRGGKRGPFKDLSLREQTAQTRKIGSCIRCRMQRIRCENNTEEEGGPCLTCKKVSNSRAGRFPCLRYKITDIRLFKPGQVPGFEWTRRWINNISDPIQHWASEEVKTITLGDGLSNSHFVQVQVRRFIPQPGDKLERTWVHKGMRKSVMIPPYALVKLEDVKIAYNEHIRTSIREAVFSMLRSPQGLLYQTYEWAIGMMYDSSTPFEHMDLIGRTLMLWISCRLTTRSSYIVGQETLGMKPDILDQTNPNHGRIPLPPVMGAQLDLVLIHHIQTRLRRELLDRLQKVVQKNKQSTWLVTYLVTFILLHNTALITEHDQGYASKHGMKRRFAREEKVKEYHLGACKDQELRTLAGLDEEKIHFVRRTRAYANSHRQEWDALWNSDRYDDDYFYVSQLFEEGWQPRSMM
ncbi:hypothetical protein BGZ63DRAFT_347684 [Mariannaea sp. PMI_226]|nr:hypothetical protein BGZ63DRAFT_347684 [Mariannaea sp. PMI_226]